MKIIDPSDPILWTPAAPVTSIKSQVRPWLQPLTNALLRAKNGISLAAPQVGLSLRFFIFTGTVKRNGVTIHLPYTVVINPVVTFKSEDIRTDNEGCLSWPGRFTKVARPETIRVDYTNEKGEAITGKLLSGFMARLFMHEIDHLDGICIFPRPEAPIPAEAVAS